MTKDEALREALEQPVQEPVACRFCHSKKGCWAWQCYHCGEIDDVQQPTPPAAQLKQEPLEYWNAVEGWVKIDEVREHFEAVNCGTIYKHGGEGRVPLYTEPPQRPWVGLTEFQFAEIYNKWNDTNGSTPWGLYHAIEKALKAKNHG
jgi:hypothetical protein